MPGLKKKRGVEGGRSPPRGEGWGGRSPPPFANGFIRVQTWVQLGFELFEEFELFQSSENSILNLGSTWVLIRFHSTWV